jgi:hypothetical protein
MIESLNGANLSKKRSQNTTSSSYSGEGSDNETEASRTSST